jgi:hypothetical protein
MIFKALLLYSAMNIQNLPSVKAVEKKLEGELSLIGKINPVFHGLDWTYEGKKIYFHVNPTKFGEQIVPIIKMSSWEYFGASLEYLQKNFPQFTKEIRILDDIVSKYNLGLECIIRHEPNRYKTIKLDMNRHQNMISSYHFIEVANNTPDPNVSRCSIQKVSGLVTEALLEYHTIVLQTSKTAFSVDDVIPAVYSQKEFIDLCTKSP